MKAKIFMAIDLIILGVAAAEGIAGNTGFAISGIAIYLMPTAVDRRIGNNT